MIYPFSEQLYQDETACVNALLKSLHWTESDAQAVHKNAIELVQKTRKAKGRGGQLEAFLQEFSLNTDEGLAMMCLAEALLRIPDVATANALIRDKVAAANWLHKQGDVKTLLGKVTDIGMALTRKTLDSALSRLGEPLIREAMIRSMQIMGKQFVLGETIEDALSHARQFERQGYRMSYDILGEGARDSETAERYFKAYSAAIEAVAAKNKSADSSAGISVKLSALHPRYHYAQKERCIPEIADKLGQLATQAATHNMGLTVDAEEAARLDLSIAIIEKILKNNDLEDWDGFGLAVQAYQKRAKPLISYLGRLARDHKMRMQIRLVKGAYWDSEIKHAQMGGFKGYPVFTRKCHSDLSFLSCAAEILHHKDTLYPMFATHNAHSVAAITHMAKQANATFEFQRLHGMGESLYAQVLASKLGKVSVYAPVGPHEDLLPYLVRRLLENGANSSFVNQLLDKEIPAEDIVRDPVEETKEHKATPHPNIPLPKDIFAPDRQNSLGLDLDNATSSKTMIDKIAHFQNDWETYSIIDGHANLSIDEAHIHLCFAHAKEHFKAWTIRPIEERAAIIERFAAMLEQDRDEMIAILVHEAGKTLPDALAELREAVDFCRYYAMRGREEFSEHGRKMPGYTGESNQLTLTGRGVFVAISPWNFPLAIFTGQVVAALIAGNAVLAKPASQTRLIAMRTVQLMHKAGVPVEILHLLLGNGAYGAKMTAHKDVAGVVFTGSTAVAKSIQKTLADSDGPIVPLIAETGGQNAMIVDSSALAEQVIDDVLLSAFGSAGQRCSALRVLYLQDDIAESTINLLKGALAELKIGPPQNLSSDVAHVIDESAKKTLDEHITYLDKHGKLVARATLEEHLNDHGTYFAPAAYEIPSLSILKEEIFGPILHIIRFKAEELNTILKEINATGYGLTFGLHSRIEERQKTVSKQINAGNIYVNRSMIGAIVGVQPFGGMGLSGTGPKAGGPYYLHAFASEKHISINTTAAGGNVSLLAMENTHKKEGN